MVYIVNTNHGGALRYRGKQGESKVATYTTRIHNYIHYKSVKFPLAYPIPRVGHGKALKKFN